MSTSGTTSESTNVNEQEKPLQQESPAAPLPNGAQSAECAEVKTCQKCRSQSSEAWFEVNQETRCSHCAELELLSQTKLDERKWADVGKVCSQCSTTQSTIWRTGSLGIGSLCNECGKQWANGQQCEPPPVVAADPDTTTTAPPEEEEGVMEEEERIQEPPAPLPTPLDIIDSNQEGDSTLADAQSPPSANGGETTTPAPLAGKRKRERIAVTPVSGDKTPASSAKPEKRGRGRPRGSGSSNKSSTPRRTAQPNKSNGEQQDNESDKMPHEKDAKKKKVKNEQQQQQTLESQIVAPQQEIEFKEPDEEDMMRDDEELKAMEAGRRRLLNKRRHDGNDDVYEFQANSHQEDNDSSSEKKRKKKKKKNEIMQVMPTKRRRYQRRQSGLLPIPIVHPVPIAMKPLSGFTKLFGSTTAIGRNNNGSLNMLYSPIHALTNQHLLHVFSFLDVRLLCRCMRVCTNWRNVAKNQNLWRDLYDRKWAINYQSLCKYLGQIEWRKLYRARAKLRLFSDIEQSEYMCKFYIVENNPKILECILDKVEQELALWLTGQKQNETTSSSTVTTNGSGLPSLNASGADGADNNDAISADDQEKQKKKALLLSLSQTIQRCNDMTTEIEK